MDPIRNKAYEEILKLLESLTQIKITNPSDVNTQFNLLNQIFTISYYWMDDDTKTKHREYSYAAMDQMTKRLKGSKDTYFSTIENEWERELRTFCLNEMKEDEFGVDNI